MNRDVARHCAEVERCNQRGGRMLSVLDLIESNTLDVKLAAFLMTCLARGASFLVGAEPGGAGKTTVMCALLNLVPPGRELVAATPEAVSEALQERAAAPRVYVCHEVGAGPYFAYLWGSDLRAYCRLPERGHSLAANLHADDLPEAQDRICRQNEAPLEHFRRFDLLLFLRVDGGIDRRIHSVYAIGGTGEHVQVYETGAGLSPFLPADAGEMSRCRAFLSSLLASEERRIEHVREKVVEFLSAAR